MVERKPGEIANPGSALGEAIGALMESALHQLLRPIAESMGCIYISTGPVDPRTGKTKKLLLTDKDGNQYDVDSVIINNRFQPLLLVEAKYIRYKKHNRDKASWVCTAHTKLRQRFATVRKSIVILMGNWSTPSKRLLRSFEVEVFEIPFEEIKTVLAKYGLVFSWEEKDRAQAMASWLRYNELTEEQKSAISKELLAGIENDLRTSLRTALDESVPRSIASVSLTIRSNWGETFIYHFDNLEQALAFMNAFDEERDMDATGADYLLDKLRGGDVSDHLHELG